MQRLTRRGLLIGGTCTAVLTRPSVAADYPDRPIRVVIPYQAGGVGETIIRLLAVKMEERLGQKLVIESKPGAAGNIGTLEVARSAPDGYTVLLAAANNFVINQFLFRMPIDPLSALTPIVNAADVPLVLFSNPAVPARNLKEFTDIARSSPGKLSYGSPSIGTVNHLLIERLKQVADIDVVHVPFRGSPQAVLALLANDIQLLPLGLGGASGHLRGGKLTVLAVATPERLPMLPSVPTAIESGFPGVLAANWWGMAVPSGTPDAVVETLRLASAAALQDATVVSRFSEMGLLRPPGSREQFVAALRQQASVWRETIARSSITVQ